MDTIIELRARAEAKKIETKEIIKASPNIIKQLITNTKAMQLATLLLIKTTPEIINFEASNKVTKIEIAL